MSPFFHLSTFASSIIFPATKLIQNLVHLLTQSLNLLFQNGDLSS